MGDVLNLNTLNNTLNDLQKNKGLGTYQSIDDLNNNSDKKNNNKHETPHDMANMFESSMFPFSLGWILVYFFVMIIFLY